MRKPGWYWVKWDDSDPWQCAQWDDGGWWMSGDDMHIGNELVVGPRIPTPDEPLQYVPVEPVGWYTEDHLDDKSATTYKAEVAQRWRDKGWPVWPLYAAPQPAPKPETQP